MMSNHSITRRRFRVASAALIALAAACGPFRRSAGPPPATLLFTNDALYQAAVYIVVPGLQARRIGTVMPGRTERLVVPVDLATRGGTVNIVARLPGGSAPRTGPVSIQPGEHYQVRLPIDARLLSFLLAPSG